MLTMSAYQVFSDTHLTAAARIIKTLYGGFPLACRQWGVTTYNSNPNGQVIIPAISFNSFFAGVVVDRGIKWNTGGTYAGVDYVEGNVIFWPLYIGDPQTVSKNGTNYYWLILCA